MQMSPSYFHVNAFEENSCIAAAETILPKKAYMSFLKQWFSHGSGTDPHGGVIGEVGVISGLI